MRRIGLVLAGGRGRRFGGAKAEHRLDGVPLAVRAAAVLQPLCEEVWISLAAGRVNPAPQLPALFDPAPAGRGPLVGLLAAFDRLPSAELLVLACDYPYVETDFLARLVAAAEPQDEVVLPRDPTGRDHPLVALWRPALHPVVREALRAERLAVHATLQGRNVRRLELASFGASAGGRVLTNVNRPGDLAR